RLRAGGRRRSRGRDQLHLTGQGRLSGRQEDGPEGGEQHADLPHPGNAEQRPHDGRRGARQRSVQEAVPGNHRRVGMRLSRRATPYLLLAPGLAWLAVFFLVPMYYLFNTSLQTGSLDVGYTFNWAWHNYKDALTSYDTQFLRSIEYAGLATIIALAITYPLAYWIAFRGGRWPNLFLLMVIAPCSVTYLIRTLAWETILSDD